MPFYGTGITEVWKGIWIRSCAGITGKGDVQTMWSDQSIPTIQPGAAMPSEGKHYRLLDELQALKSSHHLNGMQEILIVSLVAGMI